MNACESFHSKFNDLFLRPHPNTFVFIQILLELQEETYIKVRSSNAARNLRKHLNYQRRCNISHQNEHLNNNINLYEYVTKRSTYYVKNKYFDLLIILQNFFWEELALFEEGRGRIGCFLICKKMIQGRNGRTPT